MSVFVIAGVELRRFLRDRSNIFFVFIFPLVLVLLIGAQFGAEGVQGRAVVAGPDTPLSGSLVRALTRQGLDTRRAEEGEALESVARSRADVALVVDRADDTAYAAGRPVSVDVVSSAQVGAQSAVQQVQVALRSLEAERGQQVALTARGVAPDDVNEALTWARGAVRVPTLTVERLDRLDEEFAGMGRFDFGASGQLLLFVFISSLTGAVTLIQARKLGVVARTMSAPLSTIHVIAGEAAGRFVIAIFQGGYIMAATALLFDVSWGSLPVSMLVLALFSLVAAGSAMVIGATFDNEGAATGVGIGLGLVLAALGGSMLPLELFPESMARVAHVTPHAWAYEAFAEIQRRGGGVLDVAPQLAVLAAMAVGLLVLGSWALRRSLARAL